MKIEKKHIIIAIVVAVVAYFVWKRYKDSQADADTAEKTVPVTSDVNAILKAIGASDAQKTKIREIVARIAKTPEWKKSLEEKENGLTYEQNAVCAAVWVMYTDADGHATDDQRWILINKVQNL